MRPSGPTSNSNNPAGTPSSVPQEDIDLFAKGLYRSRGMAARHMALNRAQELLDVGDREGHRVWRAVADRVTKFRDPSPN